VTQAPCRTGLAVMGLAASGCVLQVTEPAGRIPVSAWAFLLIAGTVFLVCTGILMLVSRPRRSRRLAKILLALVAGSACGALWMLLVATAVAPAWPDAMNAPAVRVVGFHCLVLPIAACISLVVGGGQWIPATGVLDTMLAGDLHPIALSVGGLLVGVLLVFVGDRALRRRRTRRSRPRFDLMGPHA
jgi:hypothetical protein